MARKTREELEEDRQSCEDAERGIKIGKIVSSFDKRLIKELEALERSLKPRKMRLLKKLAIDVFKKCQSKGIKCTKKEIQEWVISYSGEWEMPLRDLY